MTARLHGKTAALAAIAASLFAIGSAATAQQGQIIVQGPGPDTRIERIGYYDLNLATRYGEQTLYRRVGASVNGSASMTGAAGMGLPCLITTSVPIVRGEAQSRR